MALDRWIALLFIAVCLAYGYSAYFVMDGSLPPFMRRNPIWPSTFPKILAVLGALAALSVLFSKAPAKAPEDLDINYRRLRDYNSGQAILLLGLMVAYALALRPVGFLTSTVLFLSLGGFILGERRIVMMVGIAAVAAGSIWYLVQEVLGIFLRPWPWFMGI